MNFNTLRYVVAVAKERNFSKAAQSLYVSQPTLSQNIQALEARLGIQLFDRKKYPIMPTHAGKLYIEFAQQVLLSESQINRRITNIAANPRLRLRIGVPPSRSMILMPEIVHAIYLDYPDCLISLEDNKNERELLEMLEKHDIDIMLGTPTHNAVKFQSQFVANERLVLAVPKSFDFPGKPGEESTGLRKLRLAQLKDLPFIIMPRSTYLGSTLRILCEKEEFDPTYSVECTDVHTAYHMASQGIGIALTTELIMLKTPSRETLDFYVLQHGSPTQEIAVITNSDGIITRPAQRLIELIMDFFAKNMRQSL